MLTKELSDALKSIASASSLENHYLLVVDSSGNLKKANAKLMTSHMMEVNGAYVTDLNEATEPGVFSLSGSGQILNGPAGVDLLVGMLEVYYRGGSSGTLYQRIMTRYGILATRSRTYGNWSEWRILS